MEKRTTLRDIAKKSGYHYSTVSRALHQDPSLPKATRDAILKWAKKMAYTPDPMVQALAAYRQTRRAPADHAPIAWLSNSARSELSADYLFTGYLAGAQHRARKFGYQISEFLLGEKDMSTERMQKILLTRSIVGVLVAPQPHGWSEGMIDMDWGWFSAITFGYSLTYPPLHLVTNHHSKAAQLAVQKLAERGYRRIGLYVGRVANARVAGGWLGGYTGEVLSSSTLTWIRPFLSDDKTGGLEEFDVWRRKERLDAVITYGGFIEEVRQSGKIRVPEELGMVSLRVQPGQNDHAGIDQKDEEIGATAVDILVGLLHTHVRGIPDVRRCVLVEGQWCDGATVRH